MRHHRPAPARNSSTLYARSEARWAEQQHEPAALARFRTRFRDTIEKWQNIAAHLDGGCRQWVARHDGRPVASIIVLFGANVHYTRGAMDKELASPVRANDLLMWRAIQAACEVGAESFHLGESGTSGSLSDYKERFGARPFDYPELRIERVPDHACRRRRTKRRQARDRLPGLMSAQRSATAPAPPPGVPRWVAARLPERVTEHLRSPLYRNGYALVVATGATSVLGFLYWLIAARQYDTGDVGRNSALIAAMTFLANLAHLNLTNGLNRFVPTAGRKTGRLIGLSYIVAGALSVVAALIFVVGVDFWSPELTNLVRENPLAIGAFVAATALWVIFQLQDSVLTGLGRADWVLYENVVYGVVKIGLLVALATALPDEGVFASWTLPLIAIVVPINVLVFRKLVPHHVGGPARRDRADPRA